MISSPWQEAVESARCIAIEAWRAIEPLYGGNYEVFEKPDGPATEADRQADRLIVERLSAAWPPDAFGYLTEESEDDPARLERRHVWIIDPIDGTKQFIEHDGSFSIHIALVERLDDGCWHPVAAVVFQPERGRLYGAVRGAGAWREAWDATAEATDSAPERAPVRVSARAKLAQARAVVSTSIESRRLIHLIETLPLESHRPVGSLGVKVCMIADAQAECYFNIECGWCKEWDTCAPCLILREAGGRMTDLNGRDLTFNHADPHHLEGVVATNGPQLHDELLRQIVRVCPHPTGE